MLHMKALNTKTSEQNKVVFDRSGIDYTADVCFRPGSWSWLPTCRRRRLEHSRLAGDNSGGLVDLLSFSVYIPRYLANTAPKPEVYVAFGCFVEAAARIFVLFHF